MSSSRARLRLSFASCAPLGIMRVSWRRVPAIASHGHFFQVHKGHAEGIHWTREAPSWMEMSNFH